MYLLLLATLISLQYVQASSGVTAISTSSIFRFQRSKILGCPLIDTSIVCVHFNELCNDSDKKCPSGSICCSDNCGSFCVKRNPCAPTVAPNKPTIGPVIPPDTEPKFGCPAVKSPLRCFFYNKKCDLESNEGCSNDDICCPNACGTSCRLPTYMVPSPIKGCPLINTELRCIWFDEQCNDKDKKCPSDSICCGNNCGTFCVKKKPTCGCHSNSVGPIKPITGPTVHPVCPPVDPKVVCIWYNEQCNDKDKKCPSDSVCCGNNCGTFCVKKKPACGCHAEPVKPSCGCHSNPVGPVKPTKGPAVHPVCPPVDPNVFCIRFDEQCNETDKKCPSDSVCCGNNCGTFCVNKKPTCGCHNKPVCPPADPNIFCKRFDEQCNDTDKKCPADSVCCGNNCGTFCVKKATCGCHADPIKPGCGCHNEPVTTPEPLSTPGVPDD